jgi:hypothetical protein
MGVSWQFVHKLKKPSLVEEFEAENHISLPADLKECIKSNNAGYPEKSVFDTEQTHERVFNALISYNKNDPCNIYEAFPFFQKMGAGLIPFADDPFGNILCIQGTKVVLYLHETGDLENVANSFSEFLENLRPLDE